MHPLNVTEASPHLRPNLFLGPRLPFTPVKLVQADFHGRSELRQPLIPTQRALSK
jgi:hypothetical protein